MAAGQKSVGKHCTQEMQEIDGRLATNHTRADSAAELPHDHVSTSTTPLGSAMSAKLSLKIVLKAC